MKATVSGIRGVAGQDLDLKHVMEAAGSLGASCNEVVVGTDTRPTGPVISRAVRAAVSAAGADSIDVGVAPTPVIFRESRGRAGIAVSASHNPVEWNGIKIAIDGRAAGADAYAMGGPRGSGNTGNMICEPGACERYIEDALEVVGGTTGQARVTVDVGGGAAALTAPALLKGMGCSVVTIGMPGSPTRGPDPTTDPLDDLVSATQSRPGFAYDLDGDRLVTVIEGRRQNPDVTLALGVSSCVRKGARKFVFSHDTSLGIEEIVQASGGTVRRSAVGEANVMDAMVEWGADAGGEGSSGGFILPSFNGCRDGVLCSALISAMQDKEISEAISAVSKYHIVRSAHRTVGADMNRLESWLRSESYDVTTGDGIKGSSEGEWVLVRESNTEDVVRISVEARERGRAEQLSAKAAEVACGVS